MKKFTMALVLATMAASPAFAQSFTTTYGTGNIAPDPKHPGQQFEYRPNAQNQRSNSEGGYGAYAQAPGHHARHWTQEDER